MSTTDDPTDPRLGHGSDDKPIPQHDTYLVLSDEERAKDFVRPYRAAYIHQTCGTGDPNGNRNRRDVRAQPVDAWGMLTDRPVAAISRKDAISKVAPAAPSADGAAPERFVVILADAWTEITRSVKPRQEYEEVWE